MATLSLREFLAERETQIKDQLRALKAELAEIKLARAALDGESSPITHGENEATIKNHIKAILAGKADGLEASAILGLLHTEFGKRIERTSLSPQLSRLKASRDLELVGKRWVLAADFGRSDPQPANAVQTTAKRSESSSSISEGELDEIVGPVPIQAPPKPFDDDLDDDVPF